MNPDQAAVIGYPISHSLSPCIFTFLAQRLNRPDLDYRTEEVPPGELKTFIDELRTHQNWLGVNVTSPHKEAIIPFLDQQTPSVQRVGAVNVVQKIENVLIGHNTDILGIQKTLAHHRITMARKNALILGTGGASKAVAEVLATQKAKKVIWVQPHQSGSTAFLKPFAKAFPETQFGILDLEKIHEEPGLFELWVNATPLGMAEVSKNRNGVLSFDYFNSVYKKFENFFSNNTKAFDLIYRPEETPFLKIAHQQGLKTIGGLEMLVEQALGTWKIWLGLTPALEQLRQPLLDYLRHRPIFLTGFMGAGKSTIGALLAKKLGWQFLDTDTLIEKQTQMSIAHIFLEKGETKFREMEHEIIEKYAFCDRTVVALGGGALLHPLTRKHIAKAGRLVFLSAQPETLLERLKSDSKERPLLASIFKEPTVDPIPHIQKLLHQREPHYVEALFQVKSDSLTPTAIVQQIIGQI